MLNFILNKKSKEGILGICFMTLLLVKLFSFITNNRPITLQQAVENSLNIKSGHYVANMTLGSTLKDNEEALNGKILFEGNFNRYRDTETLIDSKIDVQMIDYGFDFQAPTIVKVNSLNDVDFFITLPTSLKLLLGFPNEKNVLHLNTYEEEEAYLISQVKELFSSQSGDFTIIDNDNLVFEQIKNKPKQSNGKYILKLNREQSKELINRLFQGNYEKLITLIENAENYVLEIEATINDEIIERIKVKNLVVNNEDKKEINFDVKFERINEEVKIVYPNNTTIASINYKDLQSMNLETIPAFNGSNSGLKSYLYKDNNFNNTDIITVIKDKIIDAEIPISLLQKEAKAKGKVIGTDGKGVIALRFDDYQDAFGTNIYPLILARGLPCSMALISRFSTSHSWGKNSTWDDVRTWNRNGVEMWSHGTDHNDYSLDGYEGLYREIKTSKEEIEEQNIKCVGWALPGTKPLTDNLPYNGLTNLSQYNGEVGKLLMQTYAITEAYAIGKYRTFKNEGYHGLNHFTVSDGATLEQAIEYIDEAIKNKYGVELMCHAGNLDKPGNMTLEEFKSLLDYVESKWESGEVEVLTPSSLPFVDTSSSYRLQLIRGTSFEDLSNDNVGAWQETKNWNGKTIETRGGKTGNNFLRIHSTFAEFPVVQKISNLNQLGVSGEQFMFQGWYRCNGNKNAGALVEIKDFNNSNNLNIVVEEATKSNDWQKVRFIFSVPPTTSDISLSLYGVFNSDECSIDWDDVSIMKI